MTLRPASTRARRSPKRFPAKIAAAIERSKILGIRAGTGEHRIIGVWSVVVEGRVFVRSWEIGARGWYRTLMAEPRGVIEIDGREIRMRAVRRVGERMKDAVSRAYAQKYPTPGARKYVRGFDSPRRRATTTELVPA